jgi:hypothetical protein
VDVEVWAYSSEPALCYVSLGQGYGVDNPNLEVYRDSEITMNGISVPYFGDFTYSIDFANYDLDLNVGDAVTVVIDNPSSTHVRLCGGWLRSPGDRLAAVR